ncbi:hypothetical protein K470DRAFT_269826 [Piedraia hortae CBS 480.64]|uniref:Uncharacterized protein n=1 Tax=Piedraia hortae CBS 480.64 TaxID=1314780 RepID=A0A6A7C384_9PEZI|nr:hypothetical protein K470DRAFT_269826 [Piedraia hortae CBS 480.64]
MPPISAFAVDAAKRAAMREQLLEGKKLKRTKRFPRRVAGENDLTTAEFRFESKKLERAVRWNTLLTHSNLNGDDVIAASTGGRVPKGTGDYARLRGKLQQNVRSYKSKTTANMQSLLTRYMKISDWRDRDDEDFVSWFSGTFTKQRYFYVFYFLKRQIDYDASTEMGRWYMKSVYTNLGIAVRAYIKNERSKDSHSVLMNEWDSMALHPQHDQVEISDFAEWHPAPPPVVEEEKKVCPAMEAAFGRFVSIGPPPPKRARLDTTEGAADSVPAFAPMPDSAAPSTSASAPAPAPVRAVESDAGIGDGDDLSSQGDDEGNDSTIFGYDCLNDDEVEDSVSESSVDTS